MMTDREKLAELINPYESLMTKTVYIKSDYDTNTGLRIVRNIDGDIIFKISGKGEMRIATNGGKFHGKKLCAILKASEALIDALLMEEV